MKKLILTKTIVAVTILLSTLSGFSQEKPVTKLLKSYIEASNGLSQTKQINDVLSLFDQRYKQNEAYVGLSGVVKRSTIGYEQFSTELSEGIKNKTYSFTMSLDKVVHESQKENAGTVSALVNFESIIDGKIAEKGNLLINLVASLVRGEWRIIHNNIIRVSEGSEVGNCVCYLFNKGTAFFNAETYHPSGVKYEKEYQSYRVSVKDGDRRIKGNDKEYTWSSNGDVLDSGRKIGNAEASDKAVEIVISHTYNESCTKMVFK